MVKYRDLSADGLRAELVSVRSDYEKFRSMNLSLNMARGKPGAEQLDLSMKLCSEVTAENGALSLDGTDCRNYGVPDGLPETRQLFAQMIGTSADKIIVGGNSSLNMMFDFIAQAMVSGLDGEPWLNQGEVKFICPSPGYDRHFGICEYFGIKMIPVAMLSDGPDMDEVIRLVESDPSVKGMWCVPKYSNPQGITYSADVVRRIAAMKPAAKDFRVMWDNAYSVHHIGEEDEELLPVLEECERVGNPDLVVMFASTSKVTFAGGGIAAVAANEHNLGLIRSRMKYQTIGSDKLNQLRHSRMFPDFDSLKAHMALHSSLLTPKFTLVLDMLEKELAPLEILGWTRPKGGYFISVDTLPGCAKRTVELCRDAGVVLTGAGATYPYGNDPLDSNIRIAPSYPPLDELRQATELFITCVKLATLEMLISQ